MYLSCHSVASNLDLALVSHLMIVFVVYDLLILLYTVAFIDVFYLPLGSESALVEMDVALPHGFRRSTLWCAWFLADALMVRLVVAKGLIGVFWALDRDIRLLLEVVQPCVAPLLLMCLFACLVFWEGSSNRLLLGSVFLQLGLHEAPLLQLFLGRCRDANHIIILQLDLDWRILGAFLNSSIHGHIVLPTILLYKAFILSFQSATEGDLLPRLVLFHKWWDSQLVLVLIMLFLWMLRGCGALIQVWLLAQLAVDLGL